ncbi:MAG: type II secretion system F family protein [Gemmataceae bacterium]|nr:type II secretion system F family protein [Gemmataceae bacterium]
MFQENIGFFLFLLITMGIWASLTFLSQKKSDQLSRLEKITGGEIGLGEGKKGETKWLRIQEILKAFAGPLMPRTEAETSEIKNELSYAGYRSEAAIPVFQGIRLIFSVAFLAAGFYYGYSNFGLVQKTFIYTLVIGAIGFLGPKLVLGFIKSGRQQEIFLTLPDIIDLLVVCVESGLGMDAAMRRVCEEMKDHAKIMTDELAISNFQLQVGRTRKEVLRELGERNGVDDLRGLCTIIIQAERFGSSIANALRIQSESMRLKRRQLAEETASKAAVKLLFPMLFFIFPGVFIILVGPAAIKMIQSGAFK